MRGLFHRHVSVQLATIWLVVALPLCIVLGLTYSAWYSTRLAIVEQARQGYAEGVARSFELLVLRMRFSLRSSGGPVADTGPSYEAAGSELRRLSTVYPLAYTAFVSRSGRVLASSRPGLVGSSLAGDRAFQEAMRAPDGGSIEPSHDSSGGVVGFHVAQVIPIRPGRPGGVMVGLVDVRRLHRSFPFSVSAGGISLIDSAGQVVFQNENPRFSELRAPWGKQFPFVQRALRGHATRTQAFRFPGDGTRIAAFVPTQQGWAAGSSVAPGQALGPFYRTVRIGAPLAAAVAALALLVSVMISRRIRDSLARLSEDAARIGSGDLDDSVRLDREDEIGAVAQSLEAARIELLEARRQATRSYENQAERARLSEALNSIDHNIHATMSPDEILSSVLPEAAAALQSESAVMGYREPGAWCVRFAHNLGRGLVGRLFTDAQVQTAALATQTKQVVVVDDALTDPRVNPETVREFDAQSFIVAPLFARNQVVGVALFIYHDRFHSFTSDEVDFVRRLALSLGLAVSNARMYESEHDIAETLQTALLALPRRIPGFEFAHLYHSATEAARVGGDFYDLFELEHGRVGITVGDISGHGVEAAVLTSLVKSTIRVQATEGKTPDAAMATASKILFEDSDPEIFATVFFGILNGEDGELEYCSAGHPTAACISDGGAARRLLANSPIIGAFPAEKFVLSRDHLGVRDILFVYTDGLTEAQGDTERFGEDRLFELLAGQRYDEPEKVMGRVVDTVLAFANGRLSDDLAILAVQRVAVER